MHAHSIASAQVKAAVALAHTHTRDYENNQGQDLGNTFVCNCEPLALAFSIVHILVINFYDAFFGLNW